MKKQFIIFALIIIVAFVIMGISNYNSSFVRKSIMTDQGVARWEITADTTILSYSNYKPNHVMRINYWAADTSGGDSVALTVSFKAKGPKGWFTIKTLSITSDSTSATWLLTNTPVSFSDSLRWEAAGGAANSKDSPTLLYMDYVGSNLN